MRGQGLRRNVWGVFFDEGEIVTVGLELELGSWSGLGLT